MNVASYLSTSTFRVAGNRTMVYQAGLKVYAYMGVAGNTVCTVVSSAYDSGTLVTTVTIEETTLAPSLARVGLGSTIPANTGKHGHTGPGDGGLIAASAFSAAEVANLQTIDQPVDGDAHKILKVAPAFGNGYQLATLSGTAKQVNVTPGDGTVVLSTPQDIDATASPAFAGLTLSGLTGILVGAGASAVAAITAGGALTIVRRNAAGNGWECAAVNVGDLGDTLLAGIAEGDIFVRDGAGKWINLAKGAIGESLGVGLDGAIEYNAHPFIIQGVAGYQINLAEFDVVYMDTLDDGDCKLAQADGTYDETDAAGIVVEPGGILSDASGSVCLEGIITNVAWAWTPGARLYLSDTPGAISETAGSTEVRIGRAITATTIWFRPD